uniref:GST C-terminal domain-containing protein n=1 Tax=Alexandrium monilatum TaxID=311494 RepID=A0A7S4UY27_9DINO|mmetsp:Transcript_35935/g.107332  ORF Transcript_35935/g.107332 Transcript_35935/m.107332 type:complete len:262 (+) Transcript_35935:56-841(+)
MADGTWRIIYHDVNFKGRAEFVRLILEDAGVTYVESSDNLYGPSGVCDAFRAMGSNEDGLAAGAEQHVAADTALWPVMFPPILHHKPSGDGEEVYVNQTPAILRYCAAQLGYLPQTPAQVARADQITLNVNDLMAECNRAFHPVDPKASYESQKEEADKVSRVFAGGRLLVWLGHFEKIVKRLRPEGDGPLLGEMTYADFALFHVLDAAEAQFSSAQYGEAWLKADIPTLKRWKAWVAERPKLKAYAQSARRRGWQGTSMM